ncbi:MAG TPA: DUF3090 family protein [Actinomycetota bacterium]
MELDRVDRITTGAVGDPGRRTFYLQARSGTDLVTVQVEKEQVELLAASILEILSRVGKETGEGPDEEELELEEPLEPRWRVGRLSIGYEEDRDLILLELEELVLQEEEEEEAEGEGEDKVPAFAGPDPEVVRLRATREQMLALSRHGAAVAARGRPLCQLCGNPIDPEGHICPAMNGHGRPST